MSSPTIAPPATLPLRDGDRMTREEFERRWDAMPELKNAELIEGVVHMPSPVRHDQHGNPHFQAIAWLGAYAAATPGTEGGDNCSIRMGDDSMPQSDVCLLILPSHGGRTTLSTEGYIVGGPELVVEVSASTAWIDRNAKLRLYQRNGVQEYVIWLVLQRRVEWRVLEGAEYVALPPGEDGITRSRVFPGLRLDAEALSRRDLPRVMAVQQAGLGSPEHAEFIARLARHAQG